VKKPAGPPAARGQIARRDFLNGIAWVAGAAIMPRGLAMTLDAGPDPSAEEYFLSHGITPSDPRYYPPALTGMRGLFMTPFATFEHHVRDQLGRMFGAGGFEPDKDILAITVNRWPHGYAYSYSTLIDPEWPAGKAPHIIGRQRFGRIAIANADAGADAETSIAIAEALRARREVLAVPS
jgi:spermidine dehydrogenase